MRGGTTKGASEQWMRNALASGSITAPRETATEKGRRLQQPLGMAWIVLVTLGLAALVVAAILR